MLVRGAIERRAKNLDSIADPTLREFCARLIALADYYIDGIGLHVGYVAFQPSDPIHEALSHKNRDYFTLGTLGLLHFVWVLWNWNQVRGRGGRVQVRILRWR